MVKKKKLKQGILKRKASKKTRRLVKKKQLSIKQPKTKFSLKKVKQALGKIALYIFTPEFASITVDKEKIQKIHDNNQELPEQILEFADENITQQTVEALKKISEKVNQETQKTEFVSLQSLLHFMTEEKGPAFANQLLVAKYYQLLGDYGISDFIVTKENVLELVENYEQQFASKFENYGQNLQEQQKIVDEETSSPLLIEETKAETAIIHLHKQIIAEITKIEPPNLELVLEDTQMFFEDYCEEKKIEKVEKINPTTFKLFLNYAQQNLNPTAEDLLNIQKTINFIVLALQNLNLFNKNQVTETQKFLEL